MQIDLTLTNEDREISYGVTVNARVAEEIGGAPGYCVDLDSVQVNRITAKLGKVECRVAIPTGERAAVRRYVEEHFDDQIRQECIEHFEGRRLEEPVRDPSVERGLRMLAEDRPKLAEKCRGIVLRHELGGTNGSQK